MIKIILTGEDLDKVKPVWTSKDGKKYPHSFSASGMLIDELAYASKQWTSEDLSDNNFEYQPREPYNFNYENDLLANTKTATDLLEVASKLSVYIVPNEKMLKQKPKLQAGANCALNMPEQWQELLETYTEELKENGVDSISHTYNEQLQKEIDSFWDGMRHEWLYGDQNYAGVIKEIKKYWEAEDVVYNDKDADTFIFFFDEDNAKNDLLGWSDERNLFSIKKYKNYLLGKIVEACKNREYTEKQEREKRKAEREKTEAYKLERAKQAEEDRKAKLLSMKLK